MEDLEFQVRFMVSNIYQCTLQDVETLNLNIIEYDEIKSYVDYEFNIINHDGSLSYDNIVFTLYANGVLE
jgi:hypothetical protein